MQSLPIDDEIRIVMLARAYSQVARIATQLDQNQYCIEMMEEYFVVQPIRGIWDMDIYCFAGWAHMNLKNDREACQSIEHYLQLQQQEKSASITRLLIFATDDFKNQSLLFLTQIYQRLHEYDKMWESVERIEKSKVNGINIQLYKWQMALDDHCEERIPQLYRALDTETRETVLASLADAICQKDTLRQQDIAAGLAHIVEYDPAFLPLMALAINDYNDMITCLSKMGDTCFDTSHGGIIRQCLKLLIPMRYLLAHLQKTKLHDYFTSCQVYYNDWLHWAAAYYDEASPEDLSLEEVWLGQHILLHSLFEPTLDNAMAMLIWPLAIAYSVSYMERIYQPQALTKEQRFVLPASEQFIWLAHEFEQQRAAENYTASIALLREGLSIYPAASRLAELKLAEMERLIDPAAAELKQLGQTVKRQIKALIGQGNLYDAQLLLDELTAITPDDPEAAELLSQTENNDEAVLWH